MDKILTARGMILSVVGVCGGIASNLLGGLDMALQTLIIFMIIDYVTGLIVAGVFKNSGKTKNGGLESKAGWKGLCKKGMTLVIVLVANRLDMMAGSNFIRDAVIVGYIANEGISIIENGGLMGVPMHKALKNAIEVLKQKSEGE